MLVLNALLVMIGGAFGSLCRYGVTLAGVRLLGPNFPFGTVFVNLTGSFLMGTFVELAARRFGASAELRLLIATGFLGGYTTFSSFSLDAVALWQRGQAALGLAYAAGSVLAGLAALLAGLALGRALA